VAFGHAASSKKFHTAERELGDCVAFVYTVDIITAGAPKKLSKIIQKFMGICAINAHSRHLLFSDFVVERSPADTEDAGGQFLIAADVREGHANKFVLDAVESSD